VDGSQFVAGPWFTVTQSGDDWKQVAELYLTDGSKTVMARVEYKIELIEPAAK
jgi:hypothetical protein